MRSIISSIWREECLTGGAHSQVCRLPPAPCGVVSAVRHRIIKLGSTVWSIRCASSASCGAGRPQSSSAAAGNHLHLGRGPTVAPQSALRVAKPAQQARPPAGFQSAAGVYQMGEDHARS